MSFNERETSTEDGQPIRLYKIEWGNTVWRYTSADEDIDRLEDDEIVTYVAVPCGDKGMTQGGSSNNAFEMNVPGTLPVVNLFRSTPPSKPIELTVRTLHKPEEDVPDAPQIGEPHRFWRARFAGSFSGVVSMRQAEFRETADGDDLAYAMGGTPLCGHWYFEPDGGYGPEDAFDRADYTAFASKSVWPNEWIGFDFGVGVEVTVNHFAFWTRQYHPNQYPTGIWLEYSDDGITWTTLYYDGNFTRAGIREDQAKVTYRPLSKLEVEAPIYWIGTISNVKRPDPARGTIIGRPITASFKRTGLRLCWTRGCPHALYDDECRVDPEDFRVTGTVVAASGDTVTIEVANGSLGLFTYAGGIFEWEANDDGTTDSRTIEEPISTTVGATTLYKIRLFGSADRVEVGRDCSVLPGCDLTPTTCQDRFNNLPNFGGFQQMAGKSPFDGTPIF